MINPPSFTDDLKLVASLQENVSAMHKGEMSAFNADNVTFVMLIASLITAVFGASFAILRSMSKRWNLQGQNIIVASYQFTNLCVNLCLGLYGIYHYNFTLPDMSEIPITTRIIGFSDYSTFGLLQIAYNLWALPVGYFLVKESTAMLYHHIATITVSLFSIMSTYGFRYHQVFFFGLIEISSVPLAIMNYCKNNKEWSTKNCPRLAELIRPIFAASFLTVRVLMWSPNIYDVLRSSLVVLWNTHTLLNQVNLIIFIIAAVFLTLLQYYWGILVVKNIMKLLSGLKLTVAKETKID